MAATANPDVIQVFREIFPGHAEKLENAKTWEEFDAAHKEVIREAQNRMRAELQKANLAETDYAALLGSNDERTAYSAITLSREQHEDLINAEGDKIKALLQTLVNSISSMSSLPAGDVGRAAAQMIVSRMEAIGDKGTAAFRASLVASHAGKNANIAEYEFEEIKALISEVSESGAIKAFTNSKEGVSPAVIAAIISGVVAIGVSFIWVVAGIFLAFLVPIFYFMIKGAACLLLIINELSPPVDHFDDVFYSALDYEGAYNQHGKETGYTSTIPSCADLTPYGYEKYPVVGFFSTTKCDWALYGTCYGVKLKIRNTNISVAFGVGCPLTGDNKCYCGFNVSASDAADMAKSQLSAESSFGGYKVSIKMNSKGGECSYYIARVYK